MEWRFVERTQVPWVQMGVAAALFVGVLVALDGLEMLWGAFVTAAVIYMFVAFLFLKSSVRVGEDGIVRYGTPWPLHRNDGKWVWEQRWDTKLHLDELVAVRYLTGPALKECRNRNIPSFRVASPVWERDGVQLVTYEDDRHCEYLVSVRDTESFLRAVGWKADPWNERGVPLD